MTQDGTSHPRFNTSSAHVTRLLLCIVYLAILPLSTSAPAAEPDYHPRWSNPTPHGNTVFSLTASPYNQRAVQLTERGTVYYSDDLIRWNPRETGTSLALRSGVFMNNDRFVAVGEEGAVFFSDDLSGEQVLIPGFVGSDLLGDWLEGVATAPGLVVAVGDAGLVLTSSDGVEWQEPGPRLDDFLTGVAYGQGGFVAVGDAGAVWRSPNGTNWTRLAVGTNDWLTITYGQGQYFAGGRSGALAFSSNGDDWTTDSLGVTNDVWMTHIQSTTRLAGGSSLLRLSIDSGPWVDQLVQEQGSAPAGNYYAAISSKGYFYVNGRAGLAVEGFPHTNGLTYVWYDASDSVRPFLWGATYQPPVYVAVGQNSSIMTSVDGISWQLELPPSAVTNQTLLGVGGSTNLLLAVGSQGTILRSPNVITNITTTVTVGTNVFVTNRISSAFGILWYPVEPSPTFRDLQGIAYGENLYVVCGGSGTILTSPDGLEWTSRTSGTSELLSSVCTWRNSFIASGQNGTLLGSPSGLFWRNLVSPATQWIYKVNSRDDQLVGVGAGGTIITSTNATDWKLTTLPGNDFLTDVGWVGPWCLVVGRSGAWFGSTNLIDWITLNPSTYRSFYSAASNGEQWIMVGEDGTIIRSRWVLDLTPPDIIGFSKTPAGENGLDSELFLFAGKPDQRFVLEYKSDIENPSWSPGPYLEFTGNDTTLTYIQSVVSSKAPGREFYRLRLLP